jgi:serine protease Do
MIKSPNSKVFIPLLLVFALLMAAPNPSAADPKNVIQELNQAFVQIAEKVSPAVVNINSTRKVASSNGEDLGSLFKDFPFRQFFGDDLFKQFRKQQPRPGGPGIPGPAAMGSGFIVASDGLIMTNAHVVRDMEQITVTLPGKKDYKAKLIGADPESDIALIKIDAKDLPVVSWGDSSKLRVGEIVVAVGNPFGLSGTVTSGIVSATGRTNMGIIDYEDFIQTDAAINPGNSGGPLINISGQVVGITTAIATRSGGYMGVGFAIPSNSAKLVMDELLKHGKVKRGLLGVNIQDLTESLAKSFGKPDTNGALVAQVTPGSPSEKAGIKPGDIIVEFNGKPISSAAELKNLVGQTEPGKTAKLKIFRDKKTVDLDVMVAERTPQAVAAASPTPESSKELGITLEKLPPQVASQLGLKEGEGLKVTEVNPTGQGAKMGLRSGDVILEVDGKPVTDLAGFNKGVADAKKGGVIRLKIQRDSATIFLGAPMD